jgi:gluconokinase
LQLRLVLDALGALVPVADVRVTGGAFRSPVWRSIVAASLGRPIGVVDDTEGTAKGAAALGLVALGRAPDLDAALAVLDGGDPAPPDTVTPEVELTRVADDLRQSLPSLLRQLADLG